MGNGSFNVYRRVGEAALSGFCGPLANEDKLREGKENVVADDRSRCVSAEPMRNAEPRSELPRMYSGIRNVLIALRARIAGFVQRMRNRIDAARKKYREGEWIACRKL